MSVDKYKFISPGIFVSEIDNTGRDATAADVGPVIIGRAEKGPILKPIKVNSFAEYVEMFGNPIPGGKGGDVAREGNYTSPTYAGYAAQAWLRNNPTITFVRLGGRQNQNASTSGDGQAGWQTTDVIPAGAQSENGGAFGLFVAADPGAGTFHTASITCPTIVTGDGVPENNLGEGLQFRFIANGQSWLVHTGSEGDTIGLQAGTDEVVFSASADTNTMADNITTAIKLVPFLDASNEDAVVTITASKDTGLNGALNAGAQFAFASGTQNYGAADSSTATQFECEIAHGAEGAMEVTHLDMDQTGTLSSSYGAVTGTLAAAWYIDEKSWIGLSGTNSTSGEGGEGTCIYIDSVADKEFKLRISHETDGEVINTAFNFTPTSDKFARRVFNTNPILTNSEAVTGDSVVPYWLGETYEGALTERLSNDGSTSQFGVLMPLLNTTKDIFAAKVRRDGQDAKTGFFLAQDLKVGTGATASFDLANEQKLFRLVARNSGDWATRNLKVSIRDLRASQNDELDPYGTFSVVIRKIDDTDNRVEILEQFNNCSLNPASPNWICRRIGDKHEEWSDSDRRYTEFGDYPNKSRYVWCDVVDAVRIGDVDPRSLPFGVEGPIIFNSWTDDNSQAQVADTIVSGNLGSFNQQVTTFISGATDGDVKFEFPELRLRQSASQGSPVDPTAVYWGVDTTFNSSRFNRSVRDHLKIKPTNAINFSDETADGVSSVSWRFSLDDICHTGALANKTFVYLSGSRSATKTGSNTVIDPATGEATELTYTRGDGSWTTLLDNDLDRFTTVFHGGFDGLDITEAEPLRVVNKDGSTDENAANYMFNSVQVAIDTLRDPEVVEYNLACMPGITNNVLNQSLIDTCESRGDAMAIIDVKGGYVPRYQSTDDASTRKGSVASTISNLKDSLVVNSSYAACYYPWVQIRDLNSGQAIWAPPSVAALGAISYSQRTADVWFAPAGFTRGGLSDGRAGLPVIGVRERLTSKDRDKLYENNVNPIAQFPAEGIVIFGQKTMQVTPSALDRINVRRLLIFLKRQISRFAATILFDQNVNVTWDRFKGQVAPFLRGVQSGLGITDFRLVLDETTTTPDLVDRNIVYAKIYVKPASAIEYIAVDFILTDSGAAFED